MIGQLLDKDLNALGQIMVTFTSTKIKVYKGIMTTLRAFTLPTPNGKKNPPLFANTLRISTVEQTNTAGDFYNFKITPATGSVAESLLPPDSDLLPAGQALCKLVQAGEAKIDHAGGDAPRPKTDQAAPF